jgi:hypothetical protein
VEIVHDGHGYAVCLVSRRPADHLDVVLHVLWRAPHNHGSDVRLVDTFSKRRTSGSDNRDCTTPLRKSLHARTAVMLVSNVCVELQKS